MTLRRMGSTGSQSRPCFSRLSFWPIAFITLLGEALKSGYCMVRLTASGYPHPPCGQLCCDFFGVLLTLYYDYVCSETDFTQEKVNFHPTTGIPNSSSYCCCPPDHHVQEAGPSFCQPRKGHEICILRPFRTR